MGRVLAEILIYTWKVTEETRNHRPRALVQETAPIAQFSSLDAEPGLMKTIHFTLLSILVSIKSWYSGSSNGHFDQT